MPIDKPHSGRDSSMIEEHKNVGQQCGNTLAPVQHNGGVEQLKDSTRPNDSGQARKLVEFEKWYSASPEEYVRDVLGSLEEFDPARIVQCLFWPELGQFNINYFYDSWKRELERRVNGYVYLIEGGGYHKIGRAKKPFERAKMLKIQLPFKTRLVHLIPSEDYVRAEIAFHDAYEEERVNGEWFRLNETEVEYICSWDRFSNWSEMYDPTSIREMDEIAEFMRQRRDQDGHA